MLEPLGWYCLPMLVHQHALRCSYSFIAHFSGGGHAGWCRIALRIEQVHGWETHRVSSLSSSARGDVRSVLFDGFGSSSG